MMKRILSLILCVLMLIGAVPAMAVSADEPVKSFTDVAEGKWYYNGVIWCAEQGYMAGTSDTTFSPSVEMTRAMLVTVLAAIAGVDTSAEEYQHSDFVDILPGTWYTGAVVWANANGIANGISSDTFGHAVPVTREQLVLMVYKFLQMQGVDTSSVNENSYNACGDTASVHDWAVEAMKWAIDNEIISGTGSIDGAAQISPLAIATRAQIAVIVKAMLEKNLGGEHPVGSLTLGGTDISEFAIVYGETADYRDGYYVTTIADYIHDHIAKATGVELEIYNHTEREPFENAHEILIGKTNREDAGLVTVDHESCSGDEFFYEMKDNYLIIASNEKNAGTYLAANRFLEDVLGFTDYSNGIYGYSSLNEASLENGTRVTDEPYMEHFRHLQRDGSNAFISPSESTLTFCNPVHHIPMLACDGNCDFDGDREATDYSHHVYHHMEADPCLSDPDVLDTIIKNVGTILEQKNADKNGEEFLFWFTQGDAASYCKCEDCAAIYRIWGRCATYVIALNYIADIYSEQYPNVKFVGLAYKYTIIPPNTADEISDETYEKFVADYSVKKYIPKKDLSSDGTTIMMVCTDTSCFSHAIDDPNCKNKSNSNVRFDERFRGWEKQYKNLYVWDYTNCDTYRHATFPNIHLIYDNYTYFAEHGVNGICVQGAGCDYSDFSKLHTYIVSEICWYPFMSETEYFNKVDNFLKTFYGPGWTYLREFINYTEELSSENEWHIWTMNSWNQMITEQQWKDNIDYLNSLVNNAYKYAETEEQKTEVLKVGVQLRYVEANLAYSKYKESGNEADLAAFKEISTAFVEYIEGIGSDSYKRPENWTPSKDPSTWSW